MAFEIPRTQRKAASGDLAVEHVHQLELLLSKADTSGIQSAIQRFKATAAPIGASIDSLVDVQLEIIREELERNTKCFATCASSLEGFPIGISGMR